MAATGPVALRPDRYEDWRFVGKGGAADIFKVFDRDLGVTLAVKILKPEFCGDARQVAALRREVLISRSLRHPNICPIHDLYEGPHGIGITMDFLEGCDLRRWMDDNRGRLLATLPDRVLVLHRIAEALAVAHTKIVHRDLKPANIFLQGGAIDRPLIMDFGLAIGGAETAATSAGTPKYMSPEQFLNPDQVDQRSDLFSFGVMAYEVLTDGQLPSTSLRDVLRTRVVPTVPPDAVRLPSEFCAAIPPALDRLVLQLVQIDPAHRPASADEIAALLAGIAVGTEVHAAVAPLLARETALVAAGAYVVGSSRFDAAGGGLRRRVLLSAFEIDLHPVGNREYRGFLAATGYSAPPFIDDPVFGAEEAPVVGITWNDAAAYARWAGGRLPTEIEWEVAAKAGVADAAYPWGPDTPSPTRANIDRVNDGTTARGSYPAGRNAWGLWDMCGNVWEWCADVWQEGLFRSLGDDARDPIGTGSSELCSLRGGSFDSFFATGRCGFRSKAPRSEARGDIGFRLAYAPEAGG